MHAALEREHAFVHGVVDQVSKKVAWPVLLEEAILLATQHESECAIVSVILSGFLFVVETDCFKFQMNALCRICWSAANTHPVI